MTMPPAASHQRPVVKSLKLLMDSLNESGLHEFYAAPDKGDPKRWFEQWLYTWRFSEFKDGAPWLIDSTSLIGCATVWINDYLWPALVRVHASFWKSYAYVSVEPLGNHKDLRGVPRLQTLAPTRRDRLAAWFEANEIEQLRFDANFGRPVRCLPHSEICRRVQRSERWALYDPFTRRVRVTPNPVDSVYKVLSLNHAFGLIGPVKGDESANRIDYWIEFHTVRKSLLEAIKRE